MTKQELAKAIIDRVNKYPDQHNQDGWFFKGTVWDKDLTGILALDADERKPENWECGTAACTAGHGVMILMDEDPELLEAILGEEQEGHSYSKVISSYKPAWVVAKALGVSEVRGTCQRLFFDSERDSLVELEAIAVS